MSYFHWFEEDENIELHASVKDIFELNLFILYYL
jgi:hypothetical protein